MDLIEDCFVKFFLKQAEEIESTTIKALIENGYRSKLSLTAMDLNLDLPLISEISLAQRSLLRKYIGALQESQPFSVTLTNEPISSSMTSNNEYYYQPTVPIKKRKFDVYINDQNLSWTDENTDGDKVTSPKSISTTFLNRSSPNTPSNTSTSKNESKKDYKSNKLNVTYSEYSNQNMKEEEEEEEEKKKDSTEINKDAQMFSSINKPSRGRPKKSAAIVRTTSQIRYEKLKQNLNSDGMLLSDVTNEEEQKNVLGSRSRGRKSTTVRTISQIRYEKLKSMNDSNSAINASTTSTTSPVMSETETVNEGNKILTPAERAILAKIEAKKQNQKRTQTLRRKTNRQ